MVDKIIVRDLDEVSVKIECDGGIAYELREFFAFLVPGHQFTPQYRAKLWDGKIRLFDIRTNTVYRGLVQYLRKFCLERNYKLVYESEQYDDEFSVHEAMEFIKSLNLTIEPRDYQVNAFVHAIRTRRALLLSPTASGKSLIIYLLLRKINAKKTLIIVPTTSLVTQLAGDFKDYGYDSDNNVHGIFSGKEKHSDKKVVISTWQSIYTMPEKFFHQFDAVIGDEAHLFKAKSLTKILTSLINAKYRIGTTGTLDGTKTHKLVLEGLFGPTKDVITTKELMDKKVVADFNIKCLLLRYSEEICKQVKDKRYPEEIEFLVLNEKRNKFITNLAESLNGNTLILYQYVEKHGKILYDILKKNDTRKVYFVHGDTDVYERENIRRIAEEENDIIIVASYGTFSTGINIKNLHNIIFASPSKSRVRNLQSIGRGLRRSDTKDKATLFDIADDLSYKKHMNYTLDHFEERIKIYSEQKFTFKIYRIDLKG